MKTVCVYHSIDEDGWMSAAIVKKWSEEQIYCSVCNQPLPKDWAGSTSCCGGLTTYDPIEFIGYHYGDPIPDLSTYDKVIMVDVSFPKEEMLNLWSTKGLNFIWIDHHISAINDMKDTHENIASGACPIQGVRNTKFAACELTWLYFMTDLNKTYWDDEDIKTIPEIVRLLGMYDSFRHKNTDEEQKVLEFQYCARKDIKDYNDAYEYLLHTHSGVFESIDDLKNHDCKIRYISCMIEEGKSIYQYLCTEAKQFYKNGFEIKLFEPNCKIAIDGILKFVCINKERFNPINFGIDYHKDGYDGAACFHYANGAWNFSLYNDNGQVDCSVIAKQFGGGGHMGAAGFRINDINKIIKQN